MVVAMGGGAGVGRYCLVGIDVPFYKMKRILKKDDVDGSTTI